MAKYQEDRTLWETWRDISKSIRGDETVDKGTYISDGLTRPGTKSWLGRRQMFSYAGI